MAARRNREETEEETEELLSDTTRSRRKLSRAYRSLLSLIPNIPAGTRMTRLKILHFHVQYMQHLKALEVAYCPAEHRNKFIPEATVKNQPIFLPDGSDEPSEGLNKFKSEKQTSLKSLPYVNTSTQDMLEMARLFSREVEKRLEQENKRYREQTTELQQEVVSLNRQICLLNKNNFKLQQMIVPVLMSFSKFVNQKNPKQKQAKKEAKGQVAKETIVKMKGKSGELVQLNDPVLSELIRKHANQPNNRYKQFGPDQLNTGCKPRVKSQVKRVEQSNGSATNKSSKLIEVRKRPAGNEGIEVKRFKDDDCIDLTGYEDFADLKSVKCSSSEGNETKEMNKSQPNFSRLDELERYLAEHCQEVIRAQKSFEGGPHPSSSENCHNGSKTLEEYYEGQHKNLLNEDLSTLDIQAILPDFKN